MSAHPEESSPSSAPPIPPAPPAPGAAADVLVRLRADPRADRWVPAFERDWAKALEDSRHSHTLTPLHEVVRTWQSRVAAASAVDEYLGSDRAETAFVDLDQALGTRP
ncbi:DUF6247 family protein (plasmid) [Streptomyces sp. BI20]|uniref:DUF6247 family protein n=1 Tax=Streptomyces sp. BI20 TaxID=3403460 RepID=UPI003C796EE4